MASDLPHPVEPARKRQKLSPDAPSSSISSNILAEPNSNLNGSKPVDMDAAMESRKTAEETTKVQIEKERQAGISRFVNETNPGFEGILKQRYTDFLVNEITPDGKVVHLLSTSLPKRHAFKTEESEAKAVDLKKESEVASISKQQEVQATPESQKAAETRQVKLDVKMEDAQGVDSKAKTEEDELAKLFTLKAEDEAILDEHFGAEIQGRIVSLYRKALQKPDAKSAALGFVLSEPVTNREIRTKLHQDMRRIFNSKLDTSADSDGIIKITVVSGRPNPRQAAAQANTKNNRNQPRGQLGWNELGGQYLHFSLFKENKDTMEVVSFISARLRMKPRSFAFAGTKDRRGVTVQRISVVRTRAENVVGLNSVLHGSKIGDFSYEKHGLELGELQGNEFLITLRDCHFAGFEDMNKEQKITTANKVVGDALQSIQQHGFLNYYGLQRFGTYQTGTDEVGKRILRGDMEGAVRGILAYNPDALTAATNPGITTSDGKPFSRDDMARAQAIHIFETTGRSQAALEKMPRKFSAESAIIRHLDSRDRSKARDFTGAVLQITRNLRMMYVHAHQSLIWNVAASERWARFGNRVIEGDLVLVDTAEEKEKAEDVKIKQEEVDQNGEPIVFPAADDSAISASDMFERARPLSADEAASGKYTIFDIVLPTPGYDIEYPANEIGDFYKTFMESERGGGLDPGNMRRSQKDFSLSGSYRKLLASIGRDASFEIKAYTNENEQMVETDLDRINASKPATKPQANGKENIQSGKAQFPWKMRAEKEAQDRAKRLEELLKADSPQTNAWTALPEKLARDEKVAREMEAIHRAAGNGEGRKEAGQPFYRDTYIEKSPEGARTGRRETSVVTGIAGVAEEIKSKEPKAESTSDDSFSSVDQEDGGVKLDLDSARADAVSEGSISTNTSPLKRPAESPLEDLVKSDAMSPIKTEDAVMVSSEPLVKAEDIPAEAQAAEQAVKIAVIVKFQLGSSQYATMALRELMKVGGVKTYKSDFSSGR